MTKDSVLNLPMARGRRMGVWAAACAVALACALGAPTVALADDPADETAVLPVAVAADVTAADVTVPTAGSVPAVDGAEADVADMPATDVPATDVPAADDAAVTDSATTATEPAGDVPAADVPAAGVPAADDATAATDPVATDEPVATKPAEPAPATQTGTQTVADPELLSPKAEPAAVDTQASTTPAGRAMHRLYNPNTGEHFYTANAHERDVTVAAGWTYEGVGWVAPLEGAPVYRMYNSYAGDHHYTTSVNERNTLVTLGWTYEGIGWYSGGSVGIYRQYNPNATTGTHNYTHNKYENDQLVSLGWRAEGTGWYALAVRDVPNGGFWMVNKAIADDALVWVAANGYMAKNRLITPEEGAGRYAYATSTGAVVRGTYAVNDQTVYIANTSDGSLFGEGWVTGDFGNGVRRYYVKADHTCRIGTFSFGDDDYVGLASVGYVGTGDFEVGKTAYHASSDGTLMRVAKATYAAPATGDTTAPMTTISLPAGGRSYVFLPAASTTEALRAVNLWAINDGAEVPILIARYGATTGFVELDRNVPYDVLANATKSGNLYLLSFKVSATSSVQTLAFMFSATVPTLFVVSNDPAMNRTWLEDLNADPWHKNRSAEVTVLMVQPDGTVSYDSGDSGAATIKGRGNSSWSAEAAGKKPYQIKLASKFDLLGTGDSANAAKKWVLLANVNDTSLVRNTIAYNLGLELGMVGMESMPVDLFYDGEYRGNYLLCEKVEIGSGRINITDLMKAMEKAIKKAGGNDGALEDLADEADKAINLNYEKALADGKVMQATNRHGHTFQYIAGLDEVLEGLDIDWDSIDFTGGYLLEIDVAYYKHEALWFDSTWGYVVVKEPEFASEAMMRYISEWFEDAIKNLQAGKSGASTASRDIPLFDLESLAKFTLISEFLKNPDSFASSTYFYKDTDVKDSLLYAMPVWDFDSSMGTRNDFWNNALASYHSFSMPTLASYMSKCPVVLGRAQSIWNTKLSGLVKNVLLAGSNAVGPKGRLHSLTYYLGQVSTSAFMDAAAWGMHVFGNEFKPYPTYQENVDYLRNWLVWRTAYFTDNIALWTADHCDYYIAVWDNYDYGFVFDAAYYLKMNPDVAAVMTYGPNDYWGALQHFVKYGMSEIYRAGKTARNFNVQVYMEKNPDLRAKFGNNLALYYKHYCEYGFLENRVCV